ncbi:MAG: NPCBM/NEW2 domain-containing protein [Pirellulales bacterium]
MRLSSALRSRSIAAVSLRRVLSAAAVLVCSFVCAAVYAQPNRLSRTLELPSSHWAAAQPIDIQDGGVIRFQTAAGEQSVAAKDCLRWQNWSPPRNRFAIELLDGSWLVGEPLWQPDGKFRLRSDWLEECELSIEEVRTIGFSCPGSAQRWGEWIDWTEAAQGTDDVVWDASGRRSTGIVRIDTSSSSRSQSNRPQVFLDAGNNKTELADEAVAAIVFSPILRPPRSKDVGGYAISLRDGSLLRLNRIDKTTDGRLTLVTSGGRSLMTLDDSEQFAAALQSIQSHPRSVTWLHELTPARFRSGAKESLLTWPLGNDRDLFGKRPVVRGSLMDHMLFMHAPAQSAYRHDKSPAMLHGQCGVCPPENTADDRLGSAVFKVLIGKGNQLTEAFVSPTLTPKSDWLRFSVDLTDAQLFALVVEEADLGSLGDHCVWREARIVKADSSGKQ